MIIGNHVSHFDGKKTYQRSDQTDQIRHPWFGIVAAFQIVRGSDGHKGAKTKAGRQRGKQMLDPQNTFGLAYEGFASFNQAVKRKG